MKKSGFMKDACILFAITLIAGILLGLVYEITLEPIALAKENAKQAAYQEVFPMATTFAAKTSEADLHLLQAVNEELQKADLGTVEIKEVAAAMNESGELGYVVTSSTMDGYGGEITLTVGITKEGSISGIEYLTLAETPGLGMKAKDEGFTSQFIGRSAKRFEVQKSGAKSEASIDAISGATITSNAVTAAVNAALMYTNSSGGM